MATSATRTVRHSPDDYLEAMTALVFRSGMGRAVVEAKWEGLRQAFHDFDSRKVAALTPGDVDRLVTDARIIRNRRKIEATIHNAQALLALHDDHGLVEWFSSHDDNAARDRAVRKTFRFVGPSSIHEFLWTVGREEVANCDGR